MSVACPRIVIATGTDMVLFNAAGIVIVIEAAYVPGARAAGEAIIFIEAEDVPPVALVVSHDALEVIVKLVGAVKAMDIAWVCGAVSAG